MSHHNIKFLLFFLLFLFSYPVYSQIGSFQDEEEFYQHLLEEHLFNEGLFVLSNLEPSKDTSRAYLEKAFIYHRIGFPDSAITFYNKTSLALITSEKFYKNYLGLSFQLGNFEAVDNYLQQFPQISPELEKIKISLNMVKGKYGPEELGNLNIPMDISHSYERFYENDRKSAALAGIYSAVVPGLGKLYIGKKVQGINMFMANAAFALQAYESYRKRGIDSPRFIVFGSLFSVFYLSNIIGSIIGTKKSKRDSKRQLKHDLSQYYISDYHQHPHYK